MSYSRWSNSRWYTFWSVFWPNGFRTGESNLKLNQLFEISGVATFTYQELKNERAACIKAVKAKNRGATQEDIVKLEGYMDEFIADVDKEYNFKKMRR